MTDLTLNSATATVLFILACLAGYGYRRVWVQDGPAWKLWLFGLTAALCLIVLGLVPLSVA